MIEDRPIQELQRRAESGDAESQVELGRLYFDPQPPNFKHPYVADTYKVMAKDWYQKAADAGNASGLSMLASMHASGHGLAADSVRASELFQSAAIKFNEQVSASDAE